MTRHLLRLIWNRKRQNALLSLEIFFSFVVLLGVLVLCINYANNWRQALGYDIDGVWSVEAFPPRSDSAAPTHGEVFRQLLATVGELRNVELAAGIAMAPYESGEWGQGHRLEDGRTVITGANVADDDVARVLNLEMIAGRWFTSEDDAAPDEPVVINERLAMEVFGRSDVSGQFLPIVREYESTGTLPPRQRVVGVMRDFRQHGELSTAGNYTFRRARPGRASGLPVALRFIIFRAAPGTTADFEETVVSRLQQAAPDWIFSVAPLEDERKESWRSYLAPLTAGGTVAAFLLLMVILGLTGVTWQSITERTHEFGLRRANGAASSDIRRQVLGELAIVASFGLVPGALLAAQIPALPLPADDWVIPSGVFLTAVAVSVAAIYLVVLACGLYPSRLATGIQPADALRYE